MMAIGNSKGIVIRLRIETITQPTCYIIYFHIKNNKEVISKKMKKEKWKALIFKNTKMGMYSISNHGNIRNDKTNKILKPYKNKNGYLYVSLMQNDNTVIKVGVHILVALHFVKIPKALKNINEPIVPNHNDFNKENNYYENLSWMTYSLNNEWNRIHDHWKIGENAPNAKVTNELVDNICKLMEDGHLNREIISILNLDDSPYIRSLLTRIRNGSEWKSISSKYNISIKNTLRQYEDDFIDQICYYIDKGFSTKQIRMAMNIDGTKEEKVKFKKLVWFIRNRQTYKDISEKYNWWK